ncbi:hypothetical protein Tco_0745214 [Tanacetum coccineum]
MNKKNYSFDLETFRDMLQICLNLSGQKFEVPPFKEEILAFIRELGYPRDIKSLSDVKVSNAYKTYYDLATGKRFSADERACLSPGVPDVPTYGSEEEQISWKSNDEDDDDNEDDDGQDDDNEQTESDNDGDDFVHPKFSTHDEEERQDEEDKEAEGSDLRVQTPSHFESTNDEAYNEVTQGDNVDGKKLDEEEINEEEEVKELYRDVNVNLERRDTEMTDALQTNVQGTQVIEDTHVIIRAVTPENTELTSLVDVPVTTNVEMPLSSVTTLPPPPIPLFEDRVKALEDNFLEFKQTNPFTKAVSSIRGIVDKYIANQMNEAVKAVVQLQSDRLKDEAQAEYEDFINKLDENIRKIIKEQKTIYKALVDAYEINNDILKTYGDSVTFKRRRDDEDEDEEPSAGSNQGSKRRRAGKEPESTSAQKEKTSKSIGKSKEGSKSYQKSTDKSAQAEEPIHSVEDLEEPAHKEFNTGYTEDQPVDETTQFPDWFQKPAKPPTSDQDPRESFNELMDTPLDFLVFVLNRLKVDTLTPELLAGPTFELMKGSCKSLVELEYFLEEVRKTTTDQLEWNNPKGLQYPHDLCKPLPSIPNS